MCVLGEGRMPLFVTFLINTHDASGSPSFLQPFKVTAPRFAPPFHFFPIHVCCGIIWVTIKNKIEFCQLSLPNSLTPPKRVCAVAMMSKERGRPSGSPVSASGMNVGDDCETIRLKTSFPSDYCAVIIYLYMWHSDIADIFCLFIAKIIYCIYFLNYLQLHYFFVYIVDVLYLSVCK